MFVALTIAHAAALIFAPSIPLIAIGLWWNGNTIAHNFIHRPFFRSPGANRVFSACLSMVLGIPQSLWRQRHLAHHAELAPGGKPRPLAITSDIAIETAIVLALWTVLMVRTPRFFLSVYLPGWTIGLLLGQLQGHFEHASGTTSHYGRLYNWLFFNDGYHVEHHLRPALDWRALPAVKDAAAARVSRWPPVLRWLDGVAAALPICEASIQAQLERLVLRSRLLQRFVIDRHERAFRRLLDTIGPIGSVTIIGGGLFPRTALVLQQLLPHASVTVIDASAPHLATARQFLNGQVTLLQAMHTPDLHLNSDLVVVPLSYQGDRGRIYRDPPAAYVIVHDWMWNVRPGARTTRVSWMLMKRLNLVER